MVDKKKKNGFTLVELLVVIALTLSILGIAIVSFMNISDKKKQEAWEDIKAQIETAAREYFTANEYLFEGLSDGTTGTISVGKLVFDDYLNKITNPKTGRSVSTCAVVLVKKKNNRLTAMFDENSENSPETNCDFDNSILITEPGAPNITGITITKLDNKNSPYNNWYHDGAKFTLEYNTGGNGAISSILSCKSVNGYCEANNSDGTSIEYNLENLYKDPTASVCFSVSNVSGKTAKMCSGADIDNTAPTCVASANPSGWTKGNVEIIGTCSDTSSGCKGNSSVIESEESKTVYGTSVNPGNVMDNVGHIGQCGNAIAYIDKTAPSLTNVGIISDNTKYNAATAKISFTVTDDLSGIDEVKSNVANKNGETSWKKYGESSWVISGYDAVISSKLDGTSVTPLITATDLAGNKSEQSADNYTVYTDCSNKKNVTTYSGECANNGYRMKKNCEVDSLTNNVCSETNTKSDCTVEDIAAVLNNNSPSDTHPGMGKPGPNGTNSGKPIFNNSYNTYEYSNIYKRNMDITLNSTAKDYEWTNDYITYAASSCMDVGDFERRIKFKVKWNDGTTSDWFYTELKAGFEDYAYTSKSFTNRSDRGIQFKIEETNTTLRYGCSFSDSRDYRKVDNIKLLKVGSCGKSSGSTPNVTMHAYQMSYGNARSARLVLYTRYFVNCYYNKN